MLQDRKTLCQRQFMKNIMLSSKNGRKLVISHLWEYHCQESQFHLCLLAIFSTFSLTTEANRFTYHSKFGNAFNSYFKFKHLFGFRLNHNFDFIRSKDAIRLEDTGRLFRSLFTRTASHLFLSSICDMFHNLYWCIMWYYDGLFSRYQRKIDCYQHRKRDENKWCKSDGKRLWSC